MSAPQDRLNALDGVEKDILNVLQSAGQVLTELSKDKPVIKQIDNHTSQFLKTLNHVEIELSKHINYLTQVSTGQAHEGSSYASQKILQMAWHRSEHAKSQLKNLSERARGQRPAFGSISSTLPPSTVSSSSASSTTSTTTISGSLNAPPPS